MYKNKKLLTREESEFDVQKQYEAKFKFDFHKMLILMSKSILHATITINNAPKQ